MVAPRAGFWMDTSKAEYFDSDPEIFSCVRVTCKGSSPFESTCWASPDSASSCDPDQLLCTPGAQGPLCGSCMNGFYFSPQSGECLECGKLSASVMGIVVVASLLLVPLAFGRLIVYFKGHVPRWLRLKGLLGFLKHIDAGTLKVVLGTYQIIQTVAFGIEVQFPEPFKSALNGISWLSIDLDGVQCLGWDVYDQVYFASWVPVVLVVLICAAGLVRVLHAKNAAKRARIKERTTWLVLFLSFFVLPPVSSVQLRALNCVKLSPAKGEGFRVLRMDTAFDCDDPDHKRFEAIDGCIAAMYLGIPMVWLTILWRMKKHLMPLGSEASDAMVVRARSLDKALAPVSFLFASYRPGLFFWEAIEM